MADSRIDPATTEALVAELQKAHVIIHAMLQELSPIAKARLAVLLDDAGISPDGMTRTHERAAVLSAALHVPDIEEIYRRTRATLTVAKGAA